ncbi:hypothetical protein CLU79DRAFT_835385 [Phycomyces nitens]|nr:hypothetical protein CLU79DRAFT_835385 [Phycomyces nitens]
MHPKLYNALQTAKWLYSIVTPLCLIVPMMMLAASPLPSAFSMAKPARRRPSALGMDAAPVNKTRFDDDGLVEGHIKDTSQTTLGHVSNCADSLESACSSLGMESIDVGESSSSFVADFRGYIPHRCYSFVANGDSSVMVFPVNGVAGTDGETHAPLNEGVSNELTESCEETEPNVQLDFFWDSQSSEELRKLRAYAKFLDEMMDEEFNSFSTESLGDSSPEAPEVQVKADAPAGRCSPDEHYSLDPVQPVELDGGKPMGWSVDDLQAFEQGETHGCETVPAALFEPMEIDTVNPNDIFDDVMDSDEEITPQRSLSLGGISGHVHSTGCSEPMDIDDVAMGQENDDAVMPDPSCGEESVVPAQKSVSVDSLLGPSQPAGMDFVTKKGPTCVPQKVADDGARVGKYRSTLVSDFLAQENPSDKDSIADVLGKKQERPCMRGLMAGADGDDETEEHPMVFTKPKGRSKVISPASQKILDQARAATAKLESRAAYSNSMLAKVFKPVDLSTEKDKAVKDCTSQKPAPVAAASRDKGKAPEGQFKAPFSVKGKPSKGPEDQFKVPFPVKAKAPKPVAASSSKEVKDAEEEPETARVVQPIHVRLNTSRFARKCEVAEFDEPGKVLVPKDDSKKLLKYALRPKVGQ